MSAGVGTAAELRASGDDAAPREALQWMSDQPGRRSLRRLHVALRDITERLAHELGNPGASAPHWTQAEWAVACAVAAIHGVSPMLADKLRWDGPLQWRSFLDQQRTHTAQRFLRIQELLHDIDECGTRAGIALVPLKGAALHAQGVYVAGRRPMADLDLLVQGRELERTARALGELGFRETHRTWKHRVLQREGEQDTAALGEHAANGIKIELHHQVREILPLRAVDVSAIVWPQSPRPGLNPYPSRAALLMHLLLHSAGAAVMRELRLLHLHDMARLSERMSEEDWEEVMRQGARTADASLWWAYPPLVLARRYFPSCVPPHAIARAAAGCHWMLKRVYRSRTLAQTSMSHLWVSAFPGIEWSRSPQELLRYASARVAPGADTRVLRRALAQAQPRVSGGAWAQLSQGERLLRWIGSPQARTGTLQPVRAALRGVA